MRYKNSIRITLQKPRVAVADLRPAQFQIKPAKAFDPFYSTSAWKRLRAEVIAERGRGCEDCGKTDPKMYCDHIVERQDGGAPLDKSNLRILCASCHTSKTYAEATKRARRRPDQP